MMMMMMMKRRVALPASDRGTPEVFSIVENKRCSPQVNVFQDLSTLCVSYINFPTIPLKSSVLGTQIRRSTSCNAPTTQRANWAP